MIGSGTLTKQIASYLSCTGYDALNDDALRETKDHILYTLGTILAGSSAPGIMQALAGAQAGRRPREHCFRPRPETPCAVPQRSSMRPWVTAVSWTSTTTGSPSSRVSPSYPQLWLSPKKSGQLAGKILLALFVWESTSAFAWDSRPIRNRFTLALSRSGHSRPPRRVARFSAWTRMGCTTRSASHFAARQFQATARSLHH